MAFVRLFQYGSSLVRWQWWTKPQSFGQLASPCSPSHHLFASVRFPVPRLQHQIHLFCTTSAVAFDGAVSATAAHPWLEWDQFIAKIKSKGYFAVASSVAAEEDSELASAIGNRGAIEEINKLKNGCLKFARERFDILRSLPKEDIRAVVESGCPNLFRKAVNSAKRLRAFLRIDEADACSACSIRGSCDRAYVVLHEEDEARTVDVVRILLSYAINPASLVGGENSVVKVQVQESARNLLSELIKLSDTSIDPSLPKPVLNFSNQKEASSQPKTGINENKDMKNIEMKKGDWLCPNCGYHNFAHNVCCRACKEHRSNGAVSRTMEMKPGDWTCPKCDFMNFARNRKCFQCLEPRPPRDLNPGDWECPKCDFLNFSRNQVCRKCNLDRPSFETSGSRDHISKRPTKPAINSKLTNFTLGSSEDDIQSSEEDILPTSSPSRRRT